MAVQIVIKRGGGGRKKTRGGVSESLFKAPVCSQSIPRPFCYPDRRVTAQFSWWEQEIRSQLILLDRYFIWERIVKPRGFDWIEQKQRKHRKGRVGRADPPGYCSVLFFFFFLKSILLLLSLRTELKWLHHQQTQCTSPVEMEIPQLGSGNAEWMSKLMSNYSSNLGRRDHKSRQRSWGRRGGGSHVHLLTFVFADFIHSPWCYREATCCSANIVFVFHKQQSYNFKAKLAYVHHAMSPCKEAKM